MNVLVSKGRPGHRKTQTLLTCGCGGHDWRWRSNQGYCRLANNGKKLDDILLSDKDTPTAVAILRSTPTPFNISFYIPGDCLVTLGTEMSASYDEAFFYRHDAGGAYVFGVGLDSMDSWTCVSVLLGP